MIAAGLPPLDCVQQSTQLNWRTAIYSEQHRRDVPQLLGRGRHGGAVVGLLAALVFAFRGAGSVAVVVLVVTVFGYTRDRVGNASTAGCDRERGSQLATTSI